MLKRRLDLGLTQGQAAHRLGVDPFTLLNWERRGMVPSIRYRPAIRRFLEFDPTPMGTTFPARLRAHRTRLGLTQEALARELGLNECTIQYLERGRRPGSRKVRARIEAWLRSDSDEDSETV